MATGAGLDGQMGFAQETTWGTAVTPTRFIEFNSENINYTPTFLEPTGLKVGTKFKRAGRVSVSRTAVSGDFSFDVATLGMGLFVKNMLGSTVTAPTQIGTSTAYKQVHTPGDFRSMGLTCQIGRPEPSTGTVRPFTYAGLKVTGWGFDLKDNATPNLKLTVDGRSEDTTTALTTASFLAGAGVYTFAQSSLKLGGTASTASGETTISGGAAATTIINEFSLSGKTAMKVDRYGLGNAGLKAEQLENGMPTITGKLAAEFNKAEFYDVYKANTTTAMQFDLTGPAIAGGNNYLFSIILPAVKLKGVTPNVSGPDIVQMAPTFEVYSDETNPVIQIKIVSTESTTI